MYADVGPSSLRKNPYIIPNPDDDQIEYAQLNHNLHTVKLDEPKQKTEASSVGKSYISSLEKLYIWCL